MGLPLGELQSNKNKCAKTLGFKNLPANRIEELKSSTKQDQAGSYMYTRSYCARSYCVGSYLRVFNVTLPGFMSYQFHSKQDVEKLNLTGILMLFPRS